MGVIYTHVSVTQELHSILHVHRAVKSGLPGTFRQVSVCIEYQHLWYSGNYTVDIRLLPAQRDYLPAQLQSGTAIIAASMSTEKKNQQT